MAIWLEIRCDINAEGCWDHKKHTESGFSRAAVFKRARKSGWKVDRDGSASCPNCQKDQA